MKNVDPVMDPENDTLFSGTSRYGKCMRIPFLEAISLFILKGNITYDALQARYNLSENRIRPK